jgi:beta-1,2-N-acetylglucosaminyltransferase
MIGNRILRRVGGLRRLLLLVVCSVGLVAVLQTINYDKESVSLPVLTDRVSVTGVLTTVSTVTQQRQNEHERAATQRIQPSRPAREGDTIDSASPASATGHACGLDVSCGPGSVSYRLEAAVTDAHPPVVCINDLLLLEPGKIVRGLNVVALDEHTMAVKAVNYFDIRQSDIELVGYLHSLTNHAILIMVTNGDILAKLTPEARELLMKFGSDDMKNIGGGSVSWAMLGQRGLHSGSARESFTPTTDRDPVGLTVVSGCARFPLGELDENLPSNEDHAVSIMPGNSEQRQSQVKITYGERLEQCGMRDTCKQGHIAMSFYSGKNKDDEPKLCVDGRFLISRNLNNAGRGLNIVVVNARTKNVVRVGHFDTYSEDSSTLEIFLEHIADNEIVAVVSFDEASNRLSPLAKQLFYDLGSGLVQNLKFRASWYFVGQKGISGFSPFEQLNFANNNEWAKPIDTTLCVPAKLDGQKAHADPVPVPENKERRAFCQKYDGYEDFCDDEHIDEALTPAPALQRDTPALIADVPLVIIAGLSHNALRLCLDTVLRQPGIRTRQVLVAYDENYEESAALAQLFGFAHMAINASASYAQQYAKAVRQAWAMFSTANELIIVEEELLLTVDALHYFDQLLPVLRLDHSVVAVSAWNENAFVGAASMPDTVFRVDNSLPTLGYMIRRDTYMQRMHDYMDTCCARRVWDGWSGVLHTGEVVIVPDVPRVARRHADGLGILSSTIEAMFHRRRAFVKCVSCLCTHANILRSIDHQLYRVNETVATEEKYDLHLQSLLLTAVALDRDALAPCFDAPGAAGPAKVELPKQLQPRYERCACGVHAECVLRQAMSVYLTDNRQTWQALCRCFDAYTSVDEATPRGLYKHALRISRDEHPIILVSSTSTRFYKLKPDAYAPIHI